MPAWTPPGNPEANHPPREWALSRIDAAVVAAARQPGGTLMLRSDMLTPAELADAVLARAGSLQAHGDAKPVPRHVETAAGRPENRDSPGETRTEEQL